MKNNLQELFAIPVNSKLVAIFDNIKLYTSSYLINTYKNTLANTKYTSYVFPLLQKLIDKRILIPVYLSSNIFSYSFRKLFGHKNNFASNALAFYDPNSNKIFILIDNNTTLGYVTDNWVSKLTIHELMHMACAHGKDKFKNLFLEEYQIFYSYFFHLLANKKFDKTTMKLILPEINNYINIFHKTEIYQRDLNKSIDNGIYIIKKCLTKLDIDKKTIDDIQVGYAYILYMYIKYGVPGLIKAIEDKKCKIIIINLFKTYKEITNRQPQTLAIQELLFPSEIIAVLSEIEYSPRKIANAIKMIKI